MLRNDDEDDEDDDKNKDWDEKQRQAESGAYGHVEVIFNEIRPLFSAIRLL